MFDFFANAFGYMLNTIYGIVNNYGVAIIIFTILLKLIMLPISIKQQKTLKKSTKIQAESKELQKKYSNDQVRLSQELMDLYKRENMSPFSGCLTSIVQFIVILSIFYLVSRPLTYMKHVDPAIINKYTEEIKQNEERINYTEIAIIKEKSDEDEAVRINMDFLGLNLSDIPSQDFSNIKGLIIPALYVVTSLISMKISTNMNKKEEVEKTENVEENKLEKMENIEKENDEEIDAMEEMNKNMSLMMPIMSVSIALIAPLGLALYWLVSNILMIIERIVINKLFKKEEEGEV